MGKASKIKQREAEAKEAEFRQHFAQLSRKAAARPEPRPLVEEFAAYQAHFIRPPEAFVLRTRSSHRDKQVLEMARHLFGRYRVPRVLEKAWGAYLPDMSPAGALPRRRLDGHERPAHQQGPAPVRGNPNFRSIDFRAWFVCVATGGSLYKEHTKGLLTKKETHLFLEAPDSLDPCQSIIHAVARAAGANPGDASRLARSRLAEKTFNAFWFDAVRFFCLPGHMPASVSLVNDLIDYISHRHVEDNSWRLLGSSCSLEALVRRMEQWHRALARAKDLMGLSWPGVDLPDHVVEQTDPKDHNRKIIWTFHQITTGKELAAEGSAMRHCVFSYKASCIDGRCSIWSLTRTEPFQTPVRKLTIEVDRFGTIVQKRGLANRLPRPEEDHIVKQWASAMGLDNRRV